MHGALLAVFFARSAMQSHHTTASTSLEDCFGQRVRCYLGSIARQRTHSSSPTEASLLLKPLGDWVVRVEASAVKTHGRTTDDPKALPAKLGAAGAHHPIAAVAALDDFSATLVGALFPILFGHECPVLGREKIWAVLGARVRHLQSLEPGASLIAALGTAQKLVMTVAVVDGEKGAASRVEAPGWLGVGVFLPAQCQSSPVARIKMFLQGAEIDGFFEHATAALWWVCESRGHAALRILVQALVAS